MTRPRYSGDECSCSVVDAIVTNENADSPVSTSRTQATATSGANAVAVRLSPKASAPTIR